MNTCRSWCFLVILTLAGGAAVWLRLASSAIPVADSCAAGGIGASNALTLTIQ
jgi:hypothetical protein